MRSRSGRVFAGLLIVLAAIPRVARAVSLSVLEADGTEYCRIAENLLAGRGYVGMLVGPERMFPPLHPVAIAALMKLTGMEASGAARLVSLLAGIALPLVIWRLVARVATERAARFAGILTALLPGFVLASAASFGESLQLLLLAAALLQFCVVNHTGSVARALAMGLLFGLAYLTRAESLAPGLLALALMAVAPAWRPISALARWTPVAAGCLGLVLGILPYPVMLQRSGAGFRLEAKSERVIATVERYAAGFPYDRANYELGREGSIGPWLDPNEPWTGAASNTILARSGPSILRRTAAQSGRIVWNFLSGQSFGSLLFVIIAGLAFGRGAPKRRWLLDVWLIGVAAYAVLTTAFYKDVLRYGAPLGLAAVILSARGLDCLAERWRWPRARPALFAACSVLALSLSASRGVFTGIREFSESHASHAEFARLGRALRTDAVPLIMSRDPRIAYYAGSSWTPLPVADTEELLQLRLQQIGVGRLVVDATERGRLGAWFDPRDPPPGLGRVERNGTFLVFARE